MYSYCKYIQDIKVFGEVSPQWDLSIPSTYTSRSNHFKHYIQMSRKLKMEGGYFKFCKEPISVLDNILFAMSATDYWVGMMAFYPKCECARVTHHS